MEYLHQNITKEIIGAAFEVHNQRGYGFLESVYKRSMEVELKLRGLECLLEENIRVTYKGQDVGVFRADLLVEKCVICELKVAKAYCPADEAQLLHELKATGIKVGLLINFGRESVEFKRFAF